MIQKQIFFLAVTLLASALAIRAPHSSLHLANAVAPQSTQPIILTSALLVIARVVKYGAPKNSNASVPLINLSLTVEEFAWRAQLLTFGWPNSQRACPVRKDSLVTQTMGGAIVPLTDPTWTPNSSANLAKQSGITTPKAAWFAIKTTPSMLFRNNVSVLQI